ncbi:MAG: PilT/PilU family type 4a pilus ATPase [Dehalococcoidia bacterium]|nr:PilT/PilU family type 4a pilus ATPase [Dehalococcoidia bacterium]
MEINELLRLADQKNASDLHLMVGVRPALRVDGQLINIQCEPITPAELIQAFNSVTDENQQSTFSRDLELDFAYTVPHGSRFRANACRQKGTISLVFRHLESPPINIEAIGLPLVCRDLALKPNGLVLVTGPSGCGKSTTLAAMIQHLNQTRERRVITIEDPIEYVYASDRCMISQREVGSDTHSFAQALKHVLRQDPEVILVGEMRDVDTAMMVLTAAETGQLVLSTGHASNAPSSIDRIIDLFPPNQQIFAQARLAEVLQGVLSQRLLARVDGSGRVPAVEVMLGNPAVKSLIREGKIHQLANVIRTGQQLGMRSMDESLIHLYDAGLISREAVLTYCVDYGETVRIVGEPLTSGVTGRLQL